MAAGLLACLLWSYWPTIVELRAFWAENDDYSVGQLVPLVAMYLVWRERKRYELRSVRPCWWGLAVILAGQLLRFFGVYYDYGSAERYSLVVTLAGIVLLVGGWSTFRSSRWVFAFLLLIVPLPRRIHALVSLPLQSLATAMAAFALELLGFFVLRDGHVLRIGDEATVAVAEACNGLRMLTAFIFVAAVLAFVLRRPAWQKAVIVLSSLPVAILTNALRLVITSLVIVYVKSDTGIATFHDYVGLVMMPLALLFLLGELWIMSQIAPAKARLLPAPAMQKTHQRNGDPEYAMRMN